MQSRKAAKSRHKLNFAIDRSEIDISSDWVQAVMAQPAVPAASSASTVPPADFLVPENQNATVEQEATVENDSTVEEDATVANSSTVEKKTTVALFGGSYSATVANDATVVGLPTVAQNTTVENVATVASDSPVAVFRSAHRTFRLRPIVRITDGLTPGQFAVYSLMFERGDEVAEKGSRLFRGGYIDLVRLTGFSKRGIQNVVAELQAKFVITIDQPPGYHRSQPTVYAVPTEDLVLKRWSDRGLRYALGKSKDLINIATVAHTATVTD